MWASVDHLTVDEILDQEEFEIPFERQARRNTAKEAIGPCHDSIRTLSRLYLHLYFSEIFVAIQLPEPASPFAFAVKGIQIHASGEFSGMLRLPVTVGVENRFPFLQMRLVSRTLL
ncbi:hypothetical protein N7539_008523 [Penicillium diatomitis]|uniref:Uncharacterized protein n=1 Tax=Penicillium diatomitis TaxID=2819901 RepID=A0A9X0BLU0_9EURO|nr:uncharacterized protein N7539_008523 [Penicillium diatomitis]KAJ5471954.1 hypothetical protein N7539_008523 [Penicillium diatomitis]